MIDAVEHLARDDKWQLGAVDGTRFAPKSPMWLDVPGFWDDASLHGVAVGPLFTISVLDDEGRELAARVTSRRWTPAELTLHYRLGQAITATEVRTVHAGGIFASEWRFAALRPSRIHVIAWTAQDGASVPGGSVAFNGALVFDRTLTSREGAPLRLQAALGCAVSATSWCALRAERPVPPPAWGLAPFAERWRSGALVRTPLSDAPGALGSFYGAVHRVLDVEYGGASATFALRLVPERGAVLETGGESGPIAKHGTFAGASRRRWGAYFAGLPQFRCSDPYLETLWYYRWYCARLNGVPGDARELRWIAAPPDARRIIRTLGGERRAEALVALDEVAPDDGFVREVLPALGRLAERLVKKQDADGTGLFDLQDDARGREVRTGTGARDRRLKGVDVTVAAYALFRALESLATRADPNLPPGRWAELAARTRDAVRARMWDRERGMFSDVDAGTGERTGVRCAICFLPYGCDIAGAEHVAGLERHLLNPAEFWTAFPVPTLSVDDPRFSAEGEWEHCLLDRPRNGRTWPALNSRLVDALARTARAHAPGLRTAAATLLRRFVRMMFHDGDVHRANAHEHYNPLTGHAAVHRGMDQTEGSWLNDLIIRHAMGICLEGGHVVIDPLPCGLEHARLSGVKVLGRELEVLIEGEGFTVSADGVEREGRIGTALVL